MKNISRIFNHRFALIAVITSIVLFLGFTTRLVLLLMSKSHIEFNIAHFLGIFGMGLFYDLVVASFFAVPVALYCWLMKDNWYRHRLSLFLLIPLLLIITFILVLNAGREIVFWDEFGARYNFIAVDYLVYTNEVIGNIRESYNMPLIIGVSLLSSFNASFCLKMASIKQLNERIRKQLNKINLLFYAGKNWLYRFLLLSSSWFFIGYWILKRD